MQHTTQITTATERKQVPFVLREIAHLGSKTEEKTKSVDKKDTPPLLKQSFIQQQNIGDQNV